MLWEQVLCTVCFDLVKSDEVCWYSASMVMCVIELKQPAEVFKDFKAVVLYSYEVNEYLLKIS